MLAIDMSSTLLRRRLPRAFANAHWSLPLALLAAWVYAIVVPWCISWMQDYVVVLITSTVLIAAWCSHLRVQDESGWRKFGHWLLGACYDIGMFLLLAMVCAIPAFLLTPAYMCYSSDRAKYSEMFALADPMLLEVKQRFADRHTLHDIGNGLESPVGKYSTIGVVTSDGVIIRLMEQPPGALVLIPSVQQDQLVWRCMMVPTQKTPSPCRFFNKTQPGQ